MLIIYRRVGPLQVLFAWLIGDYAPLCTPTSRIDFPSGMFSVVEAGVTPNGAKIPDAIMDHAPLERGSSLYDILNIASLSPEEGTLHLYLAPYRRKPGNLTEL